jgi:hypothetical protein
MLDLLTVVRVATTPRREVLTVVAPQRVGRRVQLFTSTSHNLVRWEATMVVRDDGYGGEGGGGEEVRGEGLFTDTGGGGGLGVVDDCERLVGMGRDDAVMSVGATIDFDVITVLRRPRRRGGHGGGKERRRRKEWNGTGESVNR